MRFHVCAAALCTAATLAVAAQRAEAASVRQVATVAIPGEKLTAFDISVVEGGTYYLADRSNKAVDMVDVATATFKGRVGGFVGPSTSTDTAGPDGVLVVPSLGQVWAGDGDSTAKVIDLKTKAIIATIPTGGKSRVDEMSVDDTGSYVLAANNADDPPFVSLISTKPDHKVLATIAFPNASNGLEASVWDAGTHLFYLAVPEIDKDKTKGEIAAIDPVAGKVVKTFPLDKCQPAGLVQGPGTTLLAGCSDDAVKAGFDPMTVLLDMTDGKTVKTFTQVGGSDEVAFDPKNQLFLTASRGMKGGPVLGVIDAAANAWVANLPAAKNTHSVAADPASGKVFVPQTPTAACPNGCVAIFASTP